MAKNTLATVTAIPQAMQQDAGRYLGKKQIDQFLANAKVAEKDIAPLRDDMLGLAAAKLSHETSKLAMGQYLSNIRQRTERYKGIMARIMKGFGLGKRQGDRLILAYESAAAMFPESVLKAAIIKGLDISNPTLKQPLGKYTHVVKHLLPPPRNPDPVQANEYIDQVKQTYKDSQKRKAKRSGPVDRSAEVEKDPKFLLRQQYRGIKNALEYVPSRKRVEWFESLVGMTHMGIASQKSFKPEAIPESFDRGAGRPSDATEQAQTAA
jgi:hypothetical protein